MRDTGLFRGLFQSFMPRSSNGRTADFQSANRSSILLRGTFVVSKTMRHYRVEVQLEARAFELCMPRELEVSSSTPGHPTAGLIENDDGRIGAKVLVAAYVAFNHAGEGSSPSGPTVFHEMVNPTRKGLIIY